MYIFDTSFLIALLIADDVLHITAKETITPLILNDQQIFLNELVYYETITVLTYKLWTAGIDLLDGLLSNLSSHIITSSRYEYRDFFKAVHKKMSMEDVATVLDCLKWWYTLLTFDKQQQSLLKRFQQ